MMVNGCFKDLMSVLGDPAYKNILVAGHKRPDSDLVFSVKYWTDFLNVHKGKSAVGVIGRGAYPDVQAYCEYFKLELAKADEPIKKKFDLLFLVDCQYDPARIGLPPDVDHANIPLVCLDAHSLVSEESLSRYKAYLIDDSTRATASLTIKEMGEELPELDEQMSTLAKLAIFVDTNKMHEATSNDKYASYKATKNANEGLVLEFLTPRLTREGRRALNDALLNNVTIGSCEFVYIRNLKPENQIVIPLAAEQLLEHYDSKPISIAAGFVSGKGAGEHRIDLSIRDGRAITERRADKLAKSMFGDGNAGGDSYKAGGSLVLPFFERCIYNPSFSDLMRRSLEKIIQKSDVGGQFNEASIDTTKQIKDLASVGGSLKELLTNKTLTKEGLAISSRTQMNYHEMGKFTTSYVNFLEGEAFAPAIKEEDIRGLLHAHDVLMRLENTDGSVVYGLVQKNMGKSYIFAVVADKGKNNYGMDIEKLATTIFGDYLYGEVERQDLGGGVNASRTLIKIDIPDFMRQIYNDPLLARVVYEEVAARLDSMLGESEKYRVWKETYLPK